MIKYFAPISQIRPKQKILFITTPDSLLSFWQEMHKKKTKKKSFFYLLKLKKIKRKFAQKGKAKKTFAFKDNISLDQSVLFSNNNEAHNTLFIRSKDSIPKEASFYTSCEYISPKAYHHGGYNLHGELVLQHIQEACRPFESLEFVKIFLDEEEEIANTSEEEEEEITSTSDESKEITSTSEKDRERTCQMKTKEYLAFIRKTQYPNREKLS